MLWRLLEGVNGPERILEFMRFDTVPYLGIRHFRNS
jgi:hypothetical protein